MRFPLLLGLLVCASVALAGQAGLGPPPESGEAQIWYLGHAGWLVRTSEHYLIFDYTGPIGNGALSSGKLSPEVLSGQRVVLFVSHAHGDHFNPRVLGLRESVEPLAVVMGWEEPDAGSVVVPEDGQWTEVLGAKVFTLHHDYDGIPEGFFLVRSGGLTLYHSGDHGTWSEPPKAAFTDRIDRMAAASEGIDVAFISAFGRRPGAGALNPGDTYTIRKLAPRVTFPMHRGGRENLYDAFAQEAASLELPTTVGVAEAPGAFFHFKEGTIRRRGTTPIPIRSSDTRP